MKKITLLEFITQAWNTFNVNINVSGIHAFKYLACDPPVINPSISLESALVLYSIVKDHSTGIVIQNSCMPDSFDKNTSALFLIPATGKPKHWIVKFYPGNI